MDFNAVINEELGLKGLWTLDVDKNENSVNLEFSQWTFRSS